MICTDIGSWTYSCSWNKAEHLGSTWLGTESYRFHPPAAKRLPTRAMFIIPPLLCSNSHLNSGKIWLLCRAASRNARYGLWFYDNKCETKEVVVDMIVRQTRGSHQ